MNARKIMSLICMIIALLLIGNLFLPFISDGDINWSFWKYLDNNGGIEVAIIVLIGLIIIAVDCLLHLCGAIKAARFAYFPLGYYSIYHLVVLINLAKNNLAKYLSIGFYLGFIFSIVILVLLFVSSLLERNGNASSPRKAPQLVGYNPQTGEPIYR